MWRLCFLFSLLIKMCNVYIVREQTEPWLAFHVLGNGSCVLLAVASCVPGSYKFDPLCNGGTVQQDVEGWRGQHSLPSISLESLLCLPAGLPQGTQTCPRWSADSQFHPLHPPPFYGSSALAFSGLLATSVSTSLPPPMVLVCSAAITKYPD